MTKEQFKSKLKSVQKEITSLYMDSGVRTDSRMFVRLIDSGFFLGLVMADIDDYQENDEGLDYGI